VSLYRQQALIEASPETIWELLGNPNRHPEWWPRVVQVKVDGMDLPVQGSKYRQVTKAAVGKIETDLYVEHLEDAREVHVRCLDTGTYTRWVLTEARGDTFIDAEFGIDPIGIGNRLFDRVAGKRYFRRWLEQSLDALKEAVRTDKAAKRASSR
jgi:uncharacterized protein YndB with AHSA1/START domain